MDKEKVNERSKDNEQQPERKTTSDIQENQSLNKDLFHTDQQEGYMNNGELGANLPAEEKE